MIFIGVLFQMTFLTDSFIAITSNTHRTTEHN